MPDPYVPSSDVQPAGVQQAYVQSADVQQPPNGPPPPKPTFSIQRQEQSDWCWAAVAASVSAFFNYPRPGMKQCEVAANVLNVETGACCKTPDDFNMPETLQSALTVTRNLGDPPFDAPPTFDSLRSHTDVGNPVCARIQWEGGGGHFIVIDNCYVSASGVQMVHVADPVLGPAQYRYDDVVSGYRGAGFWSDTYVVKK